MFINIIRVVNVNTEAPELNNNKSRMFQYLISRSNKTIHVLSAIRYNVMSITFLLLKTSKWL